MGSVGGVSPLYNPRVLTTQALSLKYGTLSHLGSHPYKVCIMFPPYNVMDGRLPCMEVDSIGSINGRFLQ